MKKYWFYGIMPNDCISENNLNDDQKKIIKEENNKKEDVKEGWLGYKKENYWEFMKHGYPVITVNENKGNIARMQLKKILEEKF